MAIHWRTVQIRPVFGRIVVMTVAILSNVLRIFLFFCPPSLFCSCRVSRNTGMEVDICRRQERHKFANLRSQTANYFFFPFFLYFLKYVSCLRLSNTKILFDSMLA